MHILISAVSSARCPSGICRHAANLAVSLASSRAVSRVSLLIGPWQTTYFRQAFNLETKGLDIVTADVENNAYHRNRWYYQTLPAIALSRGADIVHLSFPAPIARQRFPCPVVCSLHDLYPYDVPANFGSARVLFNRFFLRRCLEQSDVVVCVSDFTQHRLHLHAPALPRQKIARIYQSVLLDPASSRAPDVKQLRSHPFLLAVAQHRSNKNLKLLLSAFNALRQLGKQYRTLHLVIVGAAGPETNTLHGIIERYALGDHVHFRSALCDAELSWLYQHAAVVVVPSRIEGFCLPLAEALQCGGNVLCSDIPILREVGGPSCRYFSLGVTDPAAELASSIAAALTGPKPQSNATHRFSTEQITPEYLALYRSLLLDATHPEAGDLSGDHVLSPEKYAV